MIIIMIIRRDTIRAIKEVQGRIQTESCFGQSELLIVVFRPDVYPK